MNRSQVENWMRVARSVPGWAWVATACVMTFMFASALVLVNRVV